MPSARIIKATEQRSESIYNGGSRTAHTPEDMRALLADPELALPLKFTAILAAYACLPRFVDRPLRLADFRNLIPDDFWEEHFRFGYTKYLGGWVPIDWGEDEWFYSLGIGPSGSPYGWHGLYLVSRRAFLHWGEEPNGYFHPPLDVEVSKFAICHPFLHSELHEGTAIHLFTSA